MHRANRNQTIKAATILAAVLLLSLSAWAQSFRGAIRGTVTDPSGSVIAGAKVTAKNINTGLQLYEYSLVLLLGVAVILAMVL